MGQLRWEGDQDKVENTGSQTGPPDTESAPAPRLLTSPKPSGNAVGDGASNFPSSRGDVLSRGGRFPNIPLSVRAWPICSFLETVQVDDATKPCSLASDLARQGSLIVLNLEFSHL